MKNTLNYLSNKAICAALVVLGAFAASAELVKTPILDAENVSVGYKVTGLENGEVAMVYTNHLRTATWTVPANLKNVQFLVVGGGGGGAGGYGPGGGGGGVATGFLSKISKDLKLTVTVGVGGEKGAGTQGAPRVKGMNGALSKITVFDSDTDLVVAYGGGGGMETENLQYTGSGAGGWATGGSVAATNVRVGKSAGDIGAFNNYENIIIENSSLSGKKGGDGNKTNMANTTGSGGGGGALGEGYPSQSRASDAIGGDGGQGFVSSITGFSIIYGAGGGGGGSATCGIGGGDVNSGAGNGARGNDPRSAATSGLANQGGGGGGGGFNNSDYRNGGNGGSGIVVFRYKEPNTSGFKVIVR